MYPLRGKYEEDTEFLFFLVVGKTLTISCSHFSHFKVRLELQEKLDCDLTDRKKEVDSLVMEVKFQNFPVSSVLLLS